MKTCFACSHYQPVNKDIRSSEHSPLFLRTMALYIAAFDCLIKKYITYLHKYLVNQAKYSRLNKYLRHRNRFYFYFKQLIQKKMKLRYRETETASIENYLIGYLTSLKHLVATFVAFRQGTLNKGLKKYPGLE